MELAIRQRLGGNWERISIWIIAILIVGATLGIGYFATPYTAPPDQLDRAEPTTGVTISTLPDGDGYVLSPTGDNPTTGAVFYPGARVHPNAYVPMLAPVVADTGVRIIIPKAPLNLAVLDPGMASGVIDAYPDIDRWYVGGHSLGGAMACRFVDNHPGRVTGLFLVAAYCDRDISETGVRILLIRGSRDTVLNQQAYQRNLENLPENSTTTVLIQGMNHSQAGAYHGQPGDSQATISYEQAHDRLRDALRYLLT